MKNFSITQFFANETFKVGEFFKTGAKNQAYAGFPVNNIQLLFYRKEALARQKNETDEDVAKKAQERIEKIQQTLQAYASNPAEETQPDYPNEVVAMVSDWQKLRAEDAPKEQFDGWNQKFNGYVDNNPAPLSGLLTEGAKMVGKKAVSSLASKAISAIGTAGGPLGKAASLIAAKFGPEALSWIKRKLPVVFAVIGGGIGLIVGGFGGAAAGIFGGAILGGGLSGGAAGIQGAFTSVVGGAQALAAGIVGATMSAIIAPLIIAAVAVPAAVALILFIINAGAYVVPSAGRPAGQACVPSTDKSASSSGLPICSAECPSGWPMVPSSGGVFPIVQGPSGLYTHKSLEAIDIETQRRTGYPVRATHTGTVYKTFPNQNADAYGKLVVLKGVCNGQVFYSMYAHLSTIEVADGTDIQAGQQIGLSGISGTDNAHLHYEFRANFSPMVRTNENLPPFMGIPYIPKDVKRGCYNGLNPSEGDPCLVNVP